jgi:nucleoid-associated protein YgaU
MRKDVKLGFAIGGVLLAVLIVYVLVVPGGGDKRVASATGEASQSGNGSGVSLEPVAPTTPTTPATQPSGGAATAGATGTPPPAAPATFTPPASGTDPFEQPDAVATNTTTNNNNVKDVDWSKLLNDSQMLMVQTPSKPVVSTPASPSSSSAAESKPTEVAIAGPTPDITKPGPTPVTPPPAPAPEQSAPPPSPQSGNPPSEPAQANSNDGAGGAAPTVLEADPPAPGGVTPPSGNGTGATTADATGQKIHVVQPGESFSTISMIAYGNPNLYAAIMRANPGVDPQKLRPGMKINIPPASEAMPAPKPTAAAPTVATPSAPRVVSGESAQTARAEQPIDPQTQYRVQPGDNLYSISKKLYGRGDRYLRIHEANKQTLGEDANTLKAGMVLTLPEPPTAK